MGQNERWGEGGRSMATLPVPLGSYASHLPYRTNLELVTLYLVVIVDVSLEVTLGILAQGASMNRTWGFDEFRKLSSKMKWPAVPI